MTKRLIIRITRSRRNGWQVLETGVKPRIRPTQAEAVGFATIRARDELASGGLAQVVLHGVNGTIRWERTYGKDPRRTRG